MSLPDSATLIPAPALPARAGQLLTIDVRGRRSERRLGVLALLGMAIATTLLTLPLIATPLMLASAATLVLAGLWWHGWLGGVRRLTGVSWLSDGRWLLTDGRANFAATLSPHCRVGARWLWLCWHIDAGGRGPRRRSMLLVRGDLNERDLRRLSVRLRLESVSRQSTQTEWVGA